MIDADVTENYVTLNVTADDISYYLLMMSQLLSLLLMSRYIILLMRMSITVVLMSR